MNGASIWIAGRSVGADRMFASGLERYGWRDRAGQLAFCGGGDLPLPGGHSVA